MEGSGDRKVTYQRMVQSLQSGRQVYKDVCMFIVELSAGKVTVNVNLGGTSIVALPVSSFAGEKGPALEMKSCCFE